MAKLLNTSIKDCLSLREIICTPNASTVSPNTTFLPISVTSTASSGTGINSAQIKLVVKSSYGAERTHDYQYVFQGEYGNGMKFWAETTNGGGSTSYLGTSDKTWTYTYTQGIYIGNTAGRSYLTQTSYGLSVQAFQGSMYPSANSSSTTTGYNLGNTNYKWRYLWAYSGTIQLSDKSAKDSVHYLDSSISPKLRSASITSNSEITTQDVIDFCKSIRPVTFCYKDGKGKATEENSEPEMIQLGLIADDLASSSLFKYVGVENEVLDIDEEGNPVEGTEHVSRGLQLLPLTVAALTACKYLINEVEELKSKL